MATGTVKWFSDEKGFGFITPDDQGKDLFVHHTGIAGSGFKSLAEGAKVSYDAEQSAPGPERGERSDALAPSRSSRRPPARRACGRLARNPRRERHMASNAKKKTTMAKLNRENAVRERRLRKTGAQRGSSPRGRAAGAGSPRAADA